MNILLKISTDNELIAYEAMSLAFFLATFEHHLQLYFLGNSDALLLDSGTRIFGMIQSLALYDMPCAWADFDTQFDPMIQNTLTKPNKTLEFDSILRF